MKQIYVDFFFISFHLLEEINFQKNIYFLYNEVTKKIIIYFWL